MEENVIRIDINEKDAAVYLPFDSKFHLLLAELGRLYPEAVIEITKEKESNYAR